MAAHSHPSHATPRYAAIAALFTALEALISDYQSAPQHEHVQRWSDDAERITGEVARHLAIARARLSVVPPHTTPSADSGQAEPPQPGSTAEMGD